MQGTSVTFVTFNNFEKVAKETAVYSLDALVADFGGTLSLFLGFSFMTLWHLLLALLPKMQALCKRIFHKNV